MIQALHVDTQDIVVTASRAPQAQDKTAASVTILDAERIARLGQPLVTNLLRLSPSVAVSTSGPAGSLTEVRIRGAEANHTLLFVDGIRVNDPAAANTPRFELLNADLFSRIEIVRGPQSALWGSEAIGGVISVGSEADDATQKVQALAELGSFQFRRAAVQGAGRTGDLSLSGAVGWQRARGIDSFDGSGDRDGYRNLSGRLRAAWSVSDFVELGASGFALSGRNDFDGYSAVTFARADTPDSTNNRLRAGRLWGRVGEENGTLVARVSGSMLTSSNRNLFAGDEINRTSGKRRTLGAQLEHRFSTNAIQHILIAAADLENEEFTARDVIYGGFSNQDRDRSHQALTVEWRGVAGPVSAGVVARHDRFSRFKDATNVRGSLLGELGGGLSLVASYAQGIAQPTFFDLYGFFPGFFVGNPRLRPESSRGFEVGARYRRQAVRASVSLYRQRLKDEIVDTPDFTSTINASGTSRRSGLEAELGWEAGAWLRLSAHYAYLKASEGDGNSNPATELRRPKHSGSLVADGSRGRISYGASVAYTGDHIDRRDSYPYDRVRLPAYWRADARLSYAVDSGIELFGRMANAFDDEQQDVFGYRTEGRSAYVGIRLAPRR
ncbi:MAG: TonB-dependent receptor [Sphingomicrobium sp.]